MNLRFAIPCLCLPLFACSGWDRSNPLDPENPETGGRVTGLSLSAVGHEVTVSWDAVPLSCIKDYTLYRRNPQDKRFRRIGFVPASETQYTDLNRSYGVEYQYAVTAQTDAGYHTPLSDSLAILPGPYTFWMCDYYDGSIQRLTYDGRHRVRFIRESIWPTAAAADTGRGQVWVADWVTGYLYRVSEQGGIDLWVSGLDNPAIVACDPVRPEIWVVDADRTRLIRLDGEGQTVGMHEGFGSITGLCWSGQPDHFWVADQAGKRIQLIERSGNVWTTHFLSHDSPPVMDCYHREGWILAADSLHVIRIGTSGAVDSLFTLDLTCYDLSVDQETGGCWMILNGPSGADEVIYLDADGQRVVRTDGYDSALAVAAVSGGKGCLVADTGNGRMVRLKPDGKILGELTGLVSPWDVILY